MGHKNREKPSCGAVILSELLARTRRAERLLASSPHWSTRRLLPAAEDDVRFGPLYSPRDWFGCTTNTERKRFRRTLDRLRVVGLVELVGCSSGRRLASVRFTLAGRAAAERLEAKRSEAEPPTSDESDK